MKKFVVAVLGTALVLLSITAPAQATSSKLKISKPSAPTVISISSSNPKKGKVNLTVRISLPAANGGSRITGSKVSAGGKSCTIRNSKTSCTIKGIKNGRQVNVIASSKNKKGFGPRGQSIRYIAGSAAYVLAQPVSPSVTSPTPQTPIRSLCTIFGTSGNDTINGTENSDIICGMGGVDVIHGNGGNDTIYSMTAPGTSGFIRSIASSRETVGVATLAADSGDDVIYGGEGNDLIYGGEGNDLIYGGSGNDQIFGGNGNDALLGEVGSDSLDGGTGSNLCKFSVEDTIPVSCRSSRVDVPEFAIVGTMSHVANERFDASSSGTVFIEGTNRSSEWRKVVWSISCLAMDGQPQMGGGSDVGWIAPQQEFRIEADESHWNECLEAEAGRTTPLFPIFNLHVDPENRNVVDSEIDVTFGSPTFSVLLDRTIVPITVVNNTGRSGFLNLTAQMLNSQSKVIGYGEALEDGEGMGTSIASGATINTHIQLSIGKPSTNGAPSDIGFTGASFRVSYLSITSQIAR